MMRFRVSLGFATPRSEIVGLRPKAGDPTASADADPRVADPWPPEALALPGQRSAFAINNGREPSSAISPITVKPCLA